MRIMNGGGERFGTLSDEQNSARAPLLGQENGSGLFSRRRDLAGEGKPQAERRAQRELRRRLIFNNSVINADSS